MLRQNTRHKRTFCGDPTVDKWTDQRNVKTHRLYCMAPDVEPPQEIPRLENRNQILIFQNRESELLK